MSMLKPNSSARSIMAHALNKLASDKAAIMIQKLNTILANEFLLFTKTYNYHWNITGMSFGPLHTLFEAHYTDLFKYVDEIAERVRFMDGRPLSTLREYLDHASIQEHPGVFPAAPEMIKALIADHQLIITLIRDALVVTDEVKDWGSNDFLTVLLQFHEKAVWFLHSHLM